MALTIVETGSIIKVTGTTDAATEITSKLTKIKFIYWYKPTTAGQLCHIYAGNGSNEFKMAADADGASQQWNIFTTFNGIWCDDLDSGELYIIT